MNALSPVFADILTSTAAFRETAKGHSHKPRDLTPHTSISAALASTLARTSTSADAMPIGSATGSAAKSMDVSASAAAVSSSLSTRQASRMDESDG